jgi:hypothetical protein
VCVQGHSLRGRVGRCEGASLCWRGEKESKATPDTFVTLIIPPAPHKHPGAEPDPADGGRGALPARLPEGCRQQRGGAARLHRAVCLLEPQRRCVCVCVCVCLKSDCAAARLCGTHAHTCVARFEPLQENSCHHFATLPTAPVLLPRCRLCPCRRHAHTGALLSLCLLAQAYPHACDLVAALSRLPLGAEVLVQVGPLRGWRPAAGQEASPTHTHT